MRRQLKKLQRTVDQLVTEAAAEVDNASRPRQTEDRRDAA